jgi:hypothetical protein
MNLFLASYSPSSLQWRLPLFVGTGLALRDYMRDEARWIAANIARVLAGRSVGELLNVMPRRATVACQRP